jgi:hypothetical protein
MMKYSKLMEERIRRVRVLFRELGYRLLDTDRSAESYSAGFENEDGLQGGFFIDRASRFLEVAYTFSFDHSMGPFLKERLEEMMKVCYEYGCYCNLQMSKQEYSFSVFSKIYYTGLNFQALRDTLKDFRECVEAITEILDLSGKSAESSST